MNVSDSERLKELMEMSESSFSEWNNEEDKVYDALLKMGCNPCTVPIFGFIGIKKRPALEKE
jgi:hypothetical protein